MTNSEDLLYRVEAKKGIRILLAVESGSRAWGFASEDSDYDIRIIYTREHQWYVSLDSDWNETIDFGTGDQDGHGWILPKALKLIHSSNAAAMEWLFSPVVYGADAGFLEWARRLALEAFNPRATAYHYLSLANGNHHKYVGDSGEFKLKRLLYVWRGTFAALYVCEKESMPPTCVDDWFGDVAVPRKMRELSMQLIDQKKAGGEMGVGSWEEYRPLIDHMKALRDQMRKALDAGQIPANKIPLSRFNQLFRHNTHA